MTAPAPAVEQQRQSAAHCLTRLAQALGVGPTAFDVPCECGGPSSACTKDKDGNCG